MSLNPLFLSAAAMTTVADAPNEVDATDVTVRENELVVTLEGDIRSAAFDFDPSSFEVTSGQPSGQPPVVSSFTPSNGRLNVRVFAGRSNSSAVAETFVGRTTDRVATRRKQATGSPDQLNFTFNGTLTLDGDQFPNFNIGQGRTGSNNNWWVGVASGGETSADGDAAFLILTGPTGRRYKLTLPGNNSFNLTLAIVDEG